ncbi:hypothetical protein INR49_010823 [Caranx melampygus]|nr:hypothetical protein INR49_010823 [Caranx melampygus]
MTINSWHSEADPSRQCCCGIAGVRAFPAPGWCPGGSWQMVLTLGCAKREGPAGEDRGSAKQRCKQLLFDGLCPERSSLLNTNSPRQPSLMLLHAAGMMSSPRITDRASGSHLSSIIKRRLLTYDTKAQDVSGSPCGGNPQLK